MADLNFKEKQLFEKLFDRGGYVLDFSNRTFQEFFRDFNIDIYSDKYQLYGDSKMKRLRAFWEVEPNAKVGKVLNELLQYAVSVENVEEKDKSNAEKYISRLLGKTIQTKTELTENDFLKKEFDEIPLETLGLDSFITDTLKLRLIEIKKCLEVKASLSVIFLIGSTLEGILLGVASKYPRKYNQCNSAPKDDSNRVLPFPKWTLNSFIDTANEVGHLKMDVKKFSHVLRDFRNYIHPYQQVSSRFNPDEHTALICWQVLKGAIYQLSKITDR